MQTPLQIGFHQIGHSDAIESLVREKVAKLEKFYGRITSCHVAIEMKTLSHQTGNRFHIRIYMLLPGKEIAVNCAPDDKPEYADIYVAINDAFDSARREIEDYTTSQFRRRPRHREGPPHGRVVRIFPADDCGFIESEEGHDVYFHRNSVVDGFDRLSVGCEVWFAEEMGDKGPQASTVHLARRSKSLLRR